MDKNNLYISDELLGRFLEGKTSLAETMTIMELAKEDEDLRCLIEIFDSVEDSFGSDFTQLMSIPSKTIPMGNVGAKVLIPYNEMAASTANNDCVLACERYILKKKGLETDYDRLREEAMSQNWLMENGTMLCNIGRLLELAKLSVMRRFDCNIDILKNELDAGCDVIVAVDGNELTGNILKEKIKDWTVGETVNHAVVVDEVNLEENYIIIFDPQSEEPMVKYGLPQFIDAWNDSKNYMVSVIERGKRPYIPHPIDISDVTLSDDLRNLTEAIAENVHEVWAENRQQEGWTYGAVRDDLKKQTPGMVPYCELTESEKEYDRDTAMKSIKLLYKLGYVIVKSDTLSQMEKED